MCTSLKGILEIFKNKYYYEVRSYLEKSKADSPIAQFHCNYEARSLLEEMKNILEERIDDCGKDECAKENSMLAAVYYLLGCVSMDVDEYSIGEESLEKSLNLIRDNETDVDNILTCISTYNQLGLLWCGRADYKRAMSCLKTGQDFYNSYDSNLEPTEFEKLLTGGDAKENGRVALEKLHTLTLYYLAQALGASGDAIKAAAYCHMTLKRQLDSPELDKADWALNAATLSQVLVERNAFKEAKNHLSTASRLLEDLRSDLDNDSNPDSERHKAEMEVLSERKAEVSRCWAKYCLNLLSISKDRLLEDNCQPLPPPEELWGLVFDNFKIPVEISKVSHNFALTWEDALALYRHGCSWLEQASQHYSLENHASDHVSIVRDHSQLYMVLAFFNEDQTKQCKMHKRRLDMLKKVSDQLNPTYYVDLLRQIWFEMGETYITMIDLKSDQLSRDRNDYHSKINNLIKQAVTVFQTFVDSFKEGRDERYEEGYERSVLLSKIHIAKLLMKIKADDTNLVIQYNTIALNNYKDIVTYCDKWEGNEALTESEKSLCREMYNLLPLKLSKILGNRS